MHMQKCVLNYLSPPFWLTRVAISTKHPVVQCEIYDWLRDILQPTTLIRDAWKFHPRNKQPSLPFFLYHCSRGDKLGDDIHVFRKGLKIRERKPFFRPFRFLSFSRGLYNYYIQQRGGGGSIVHECVRIITGRKINRCHPAEAVAACALFPLCITPAPPFF
jgi:hypothetical protein